MSKHDLDSSQSLKQEKKRRKKNRKEALKLEDITPSSTNGTQSPVSEANDEEASDKTYEQSETLRDLPQRAVDEFYASQSVQIHDSQTSDLKPILSFSHLPTEVASQFSNTFKTFQIPSSIQSTAWPFLLSGRDVVGVAETGSGKTLAFGLPLVVRLGAATRKRGVRAVIVAPTRELAIQVFDQIDALTKTVPIGQTLKAACVYGGASKDDQRAQLVNASIVVATPGRLKDFLSDDTISLSKTRYLVLDEADRMLDKGFEDDIRSIISHMPVKRRQTAMFTATWPKSIRELADTFMKAPVRITIGRQDNSDPGELRANPRIKQAVEVMDGRDKQQRLLQLVRQHGKKDDKILVFCLYKKEATRIEMFLRNNAGRQVAGIHGDLAQSARLASLSAFKSGAVSILVATDVAARGLDIPAVKLVINVTFPLTAEDYVHRIGRTGRAGADGLAITFFTEQDKGLAGGLVNVLKGAGQPVPEELLKFGTTVKKRQHESYGAFYKEAEEGKTATKITFDD